MIDIVDRLGETRWLMPAEAMIVTPGKFRTFGDGDAKLIPRDQWKPVDLAPYAPPIKDQDGIGACNAFASVTTLEIARAIAGLPFVPLSTGYLYGCINGQRDQGSLLEDAIEWMQTNGVCEASVVGMLDWRKSQWPAAAATRAKQFRVLEWWQCPTFDHFASAIQQGFACNIGMMWGSTDEPNGDGFLPDRAAGRAGGHSIAVTALENKAGRWGVKLRNSWSARWGINGECIVSEARAKNEQGNFGWFATRAVTIADTDPKLPDLQS